MARYFAAARRRRRRLGNLLPQRPQAAAGRAVAQLRDVGDRAGRHRPSGCSRNRYTPSATWPRRSPCCCRRRARAATPLHVWVEERLLPLRERPSRTQQRAVWRPGSELDSRSGSSGTSSSRANFASACRSNWSTRALAQVSGLDAEVDRAPAHGRLGADAGVLRGAAHRRRGAIDADLSRPVSVLPRLPARRRARAARGPVADWQAEWKWDGIRAQLVRRGGRVCSCGRAARSWSPTASPRSATLARELPDGTVLDGEVLPWIDGARRCRSRSCRRGSAARRSARRCSPRCRSSLLAYDLLEIDGNDIRTRRSPSARATAGATCRVALPRAASLISPTIVAADWDDWPRLRAKPRARSVEGLMLKRRDSPYGSAGSAANGGSGRSIRSRVDAVLIYAQRGSGKRASLYTDYTFAVWDNGGTGPVRQGLFGPDRCRDPSSRCVRAPQHGREIRPGAQCEAELVFELALRRRSSDRRGTNRASPSAFRGSCAGGPTRGSRMPIRSRRSRRCCRARGNRRRRSRESSFDLRLRLGCRRTAAVNCRYEEATLCNAGAAAGRCLLACYSPHHEFPLSSASSLFAHAAVIGLLIVAGQGIWWIREETSRPASMDVVMLAGSTEGSGGFGGIPGLPGIGGVKNEFVSQTAGDSKPKAETNNSPALAGCSEERIQHSRCSHGANAFG